METLIGLGIWVVIFIVWYCRNYPDRVRRLVPIPKFKFAWPRREKKKKKPSIPKPKPRSRANYKGLVEKVESISSRDEFSASDAATMVEAVKELMTLEPSSGQVWEAFALDALETAEIRCDTCKTPVKKTVKKTGVKIECPKCQKWLALRNSKVTIIDPNRVDLEQWEK